MGCLCCFPLNKFNLTMRNKLRYIIPIIVLSLIAYMAYSIALKNNKLIAQRESLRILPKFSFKTLSGEIFNYSDLDTDEYTFIVYFSTTCVHCEYQIENLLKKYQVLENTKILLVSIENKDSVLNFTKKHDLGNLEPEITVVLSDYGYFTDKFGKLPNPSLLLYNKKKELILLNKGSLDIDSVKTYY